MSAGCSSGSLPGGLNRAGGDCLFLPLAVAFGRAWLKGRLSWMRPIEPPLGSWPSAPAPSGTAARSRERATWLTVIPKREMEKTARRADRTAMNTT